MWLTAFAKSKFQKWTERIVRLKGFCFFFFFLMSTDRMISLNRAFHARAATLNFSTHHSGKPCQLVQTAACARHTVIVMSVAASSPLVYLSVQRNGRHHQSTQAPFVAWTTWITLRLTPHSLVRRPEFLCENDWLKQDDTRLEPSTCIKCCVEYL